MEIKTPIVEGGVLEIDTTRGAIPGLLDLGVMLRTGAKDENGFFVVQTDDEGKAKLHRTLNETVGLLAMDLAAIGKLLANVNADEITDDIPTLGWLIHDLGRTIVELEDSRECVEVANG